MFNNTQLALSSVCVAMFFLQSPPAPAQKEATQLQIRVDLVPVIGNSQEASQLDNGSAVTYSITTKPRRMTITQAIEAMDIPDQGPGPRKVVVTTIVAE